MEDLGRGAKLEAGGKLCIFVSPIRANRMKQYLELLRHIQEVGHSKEDRTGTGTISTFGYQMRFDLRDGFPLLTTKKLHLKSIIYELLWFLRGDTNVSYLQEHGVRIWNEWADEAGELGPVYGAQWRSWPDYAGGTIDQIQQVIDTLRRDPMSRRMVVSAWNVAQLDEMALAPCHCLMQFYVADALLLLMVAQVTGLEPGEFVHSFGDVHIYRDHLEQVKEQLSREPRSLPQMRLNPAVKEINDFRYEDFELVNYDPHPHIAGKVSI